MKKIILIAILGLFASCAVAQTNTSVRYGTTPNNDNTGRNLNYATITTTDVTSATIDTIVVRPNAWQTIFLPTANLADSVVYKFSSLVTTYNVGDVISFTGTKGTGAGAVKFGGSKFILSTLSNNLAIPANKAYIIAFSWTGSKWIEIDRTIQP